MSKPKKRDRRRGAGEGTFVARPSGHVQVQISVDGRRLTKTLPNMTAARDWALEQRANARQGLLPVDAGRLTLVELLDLWLATKEHNVEPSTWARYESAVRVHVVPALGDVRLAELRPDLLQQLYNQKASAPRTAINCHLVLHQALAYAVRLRLLATNPSEAAILPRYRRPEMQCWAAGQAQRFLSSIADHRWRAVYWVLLTTGLRTGELCGLRWADVDLDAHVLRVRRKLHRVAHAGGLINGETKTHQARVIALIPQAVAQLAAWQRQQQQERSEAGADWQEQGWVFTCLAGTPLEGSRIYHDFYPRAQRLGLPRIRPHDLRHTCATLLLDMGVAMKVVQEILGHSKIGTTMDIYAHMAPIMQAQAQTALQQLYGDASPPAANPVAAACSGAEPDKAG